MVAEVEDEEHARILAKRCVLIKSVLEFFSSGASYEALHLTNRNKEHLWAPFQKNTTWKFSVTGYNQTIPKYRQRDVVEGFSYMALKGPVDLANPEQEFCCFEEYSSKGKEALRPKYDGDGNFICVYFGRLIAKGQARNLIQKYDVKKRAYYGNTSMDAEMSLLMANQTLSANGKLIYDPFVGTGSMLYTVAEFGAYVIGSDIDGRQMRGKGKEPGVLSSAGQYKVASRILSLLTFDVTNNPWRCGGLFDAIITDPPYGVRAGAKRLGRKPGVPSRDSVAAMRDPDTYIPPTHPYELSMLALDLVILSRYLLKDGGRLVFFLPTVNDEYKEVDIPVVEGMELVANSLENFGAWGRRLITMVKKESITREAPDLRPRECSERYLDHYVPAHRDFREKYFAGFNRNPDVP
ncbi:hypothetical protein Clacol_000584 [Clathrus columnatus]|uniref:tRNA (guanine(10)-N(2))-methyltransferase n=1 Tax=Clathrus columnatus TaxID=1419009 RepID=A0AAV4ZYW0_9AGAM|nr:hypothetical protein Clacol_000584 [Clathrus columnatus]